MKHKNAKIFFKSFMLVAFIFLTMACKKKPLSNGADLPDKTTPVIPMQVIEPFTTNSSGKNLNVVIFVPTDNPALPDYKTRLSTLLIHFQKWMHTEMLRYGYDKYMGLPLDPTTKLVKFIEIKGQYGQNAYENGDKISSEINTYKLSHQSEFSPTNHTLILLPQRTDGGKQPFYGSGQSCFAVDNSSMAVNKIPNLNSDLVGGMLHELGHGLNLPHDHGKYDSEALLGTSLMGAGNISFSKGQKTFLTEVDAAILNRNEIFQSTLPAEVPYQSGSTMIIDTKVVFNATTQNLEITGQYTSDKEVSDILVYLDPNVNNEGYTFWETNNNYNSVAWRFSPGPNGTIVGKIPLKELLYKTNEPYELAVKLLLKNGNAPHRYNTFKFKEGVPQIGEKGAAKFFKDAYIGGTEVELPVGEYRTADLIARGILDKDISSIHVGLGVKVILYSNDNFTGSSLELISSMRTLPAFDNKASSLKVVALY